MKTALIVASLGLLVSASQLVQSQNYQDAGSYASGGGGGGGGGASYGASYPAGDGHPMERPRVNLGISLKVPAMKINLGRMNMPKISIRAKIKQSHGPKVINVPEMHIDTNSKIPGPQGSQAAGHGSDGGSYGGGSSYGSGGSQSYGSGGSQSYGSGSSQSYGSGGSYGGEDSQGSYGGSSGNQYNGASGAGYGSQGDSSNYGGMSSISYTGPKIEPSGDHYESAHGSAGGSYGNSASSSSSSYGQQGGSSYGNQAGNSYGNQAGNSYGNQGGNNYAALEAAALAAAGFHGGSASGYDASGSSYAASYQEPTHASYGQQQQTSYAPAHSKQASMTQNTRSQYGSNPNGYNRQSGYAGQAAPIASYSNPRASAGYSQQQSTGYQMPQGYSGNSHGGYSGSAPAAASVYPASYQKAAEPARQNSYGQTSHSSGNSYGPGAAQGGSNYEPGNAYGGSDLMGYQPLEPGHTLIQATNDNYHGQTQVAMASNPPKDAPHQTSHYGPQPTNSYHQTPASYQQPSSYQASQPAYDDNAASSAYGGSPGNYGARVSAPAVSNYAAPGNSYGNSAPVEAY